MECPSGLCLNTALHIALSGICVTNCDTYKAISLPPRGFPRLLSLAPKSITLPCVRLLSALVSSLRLISVRLWFDALHVIVLQFLSEEEKSDHEAMESKSNNERRARVEKRMCLELHALTHVFSNDRVEYSNTDIPEIPLRERLHCERPRLPHSVQRVGGLCCNST